MVQFTDDSGYLTDESDFYGLCIEHPKLSRISQLNSASGDAKTTIQLEKEVKAFDVVEWYDNKIVSPTELAITGLAAISAASKTPAKAVTQHNRYEGDSAGRQLGETVEEFLQRLPPRTSLVTPKLPWIYIDNPWGDKRPEDENSSWAAFTRIGTDLLHEFTRKRHEIELQMSGKAKGTVTRAFNKAGHKERILKAIMDTAVTLKCTSGKVCWSLPQIYMHY